jgi:hypothetical protein
MESVILKDLVEVELEELINPIKNHILEPEEIQFAGLIYCEAVDLAMILLKGYQNQAANIEQGAQVDETVGQYWSKVAVISAIKMIMEVLGYDNFGIIITNKHLQERINLVRMKSLLS